MNTVGKIAIVGAGAVGCYYGGRLFQSGQDVHFLMRSDYETVMRDGLHIRSPLGDSDLRVKAYLSAADIGPCDLVIIALKATSNAALLDLLPPLLHEGTHLLTLQNGLGNEEFLAHHFGSQRVLGGLCFVCINRIAAGFVHHIAQGRINLGEPLGAPRQRTYDIANALIQAGVDCVIEPSLAAARWKKLVWNIPFNGLSIAEGGIDTAAILANPRIEQRVRDLMTEIITTSQGLGHDVALALIDDMIERTRTMAQYRPSSLIDFQEGREVELEPIWGESIRQAKQANFAMPLVTELYEQLKTLTQNRVALGTRSGP